MKRGVQADNFLRLCKEFPYFSYEDYHYSFDEKGLRLGFVFDLGGKYRFEPTSFIPFVKGIFERAISMPEGSLDTLVFHIGMIELISYWKCACPPVIKIKPHCLGPAQVEWWKGLYRKGMGEFFYTNGIDSLREDLFTIIPEGLSSPRHFELPRASGALVPVGGGKDSAVTLEVMKHFGQDWLPFVINPRRATREVILAAGRRDNETLTVSRVIHPLLLELNKKGFLNGHTPFSAAVAFYALLAAALTSRRDIILSNESSANEATIPGTGINHQYSKSWDFEAGFRRYVSEWISTSPDYYSLLRPLSELQIACLFSSMPQYFGVFRSCNAGSKTDSWCGKCAKCLFTWIILAPFLGREQLVNIFGKDLMADPGLKQLMEQLAGLSGTKPFECVGTTGEVRAALRAAAGKFEGQAMPYLLDHYRRKDPQGPGGEHDLAELMRRFGGQHAVPLHILEHLKRRLCSGAS
jgi:hypothetical protein